jgi:Transposase
VVADRTRAAVDRWLHARTRDWLARIATVALDPWRGYAGALVAPLGHATVVVDHFRIRKLLLTAAEQLTSQGRVRLRAGLAVGDPTGEVAAALAGQGCCAPVYAASDLAHARAALERLCRWADGVEVAELSRLARTVRAWEAEILAWHATNGCSNGPTGAVNLLIKKVKRVGQLSMRSSPDRYARYSGGVIVAMPPGGISTGTSRLPSAHGPSRATEMSTETIAAPAGTSSGVLGEPTRSRILTRTYANSHSQSGRRTRSELMG